MRCKAARAAAAARAPQDLPLFHNHPKERQEPHSPRRPPKNRGCEPGAAAAPGVWGVDKPTESEGIAEGGDEDEAGEVRSEGSGPPSWPRALGAVDVPGG